MSLEMLKITLSMYIMMNGCTCLNKGELGLVKIQIKARGVFVFHKKKKSITENKCSPAGGMQNRGRQAELLSV